MQTSMDVVRRTLVLLGVLVFLFPVAVSCAATSASPTSEPSPGPSGPGSRQQGAPQDAPPGAQEPVRLAVEDLSRRLGVTRDQIQVRVVEKAEWRDSSLGCPEPGKAYAQVITPGYRIVLEAQGKTYEYHSDEGRRVVLCEKGS